MMDTTFYMQLDALIGHHEYDKAEEFLLEAFQEASADEQNHASGSLSGRAKSCGQDHGIQ